jgi:very-short-patch-repair endonuclease
MYYIPYNTRLRDFSRKLRNHSTKGEVFLWMQLRAGKMEGYQFNRQKPLNNFIVDFYCGALNLVIEVDGKYHLAPAQVVRDRWRQGILESYNLNFLRFSEMAVRHRMESVLQEIRLYIRHYEMIHPELKERISRYRK